MGPAGGPVDGAGVARRLDEGLDEHGRGVVALGPVQGQAAADESEDVRAEVGRHDGINGRDSPHCGTAGEPFHFANRPGVLRCRKCRQNTGLTVGTVMERSHTPLNVWFWAAYLVASQTSGMSAVQFQRQLGLSRYETAFQILHKLRSGMVRPNQDRIGGQPKNHVEVDETWVGGRTRGEGRGVHHKVPVSCAIEVRHRKPGTKLDNRKDGRYAGRVRLAVVLDRSAESLCGFVESTVAPGSLIVTDDWSGYAGLGKRGYEALRCCRVW